MQQNIVIQEYVSAEFVANLMGIQTRVLYNKIYLKTMPQELEVHTRNGRDVVFKKEQVAIWNNSLPLKSKSKSKFKPTPPIAAETKRQRGRPTKLSLAAATKNGGAK